VLAVTLGTDPTMRSTQVQKWPFSEVAADAARSLPDHDESFDFCS
jgi:hypothetical protein